MRALYPIAIIFLIALAGDVAAQERILPVGSAQRGATRYVDLGIDDSTAVISFFERFRDAVMADRKREVIGMLSLPIRTWLDGRWTVLRTADAVLRHYERIFNATVREALVDQDPHDLLVMEQGVMVGRGEVWLAPHHETIKVIAINNM